MELTAQSNYIVRNAVTGEWARVEVHEITPYNGAVIIYGTRLGHEIYLPRMGGRKRIIPGPMAVVLFPGVPQPIMARFMGEQNSFPLIMEIESRGERGWLPCPNIPDIARKFGGLCHVCQERAWDAQRCRGGDCLVYRARRLVDFFGEWQLRATRASLLAV